MEVGVYSLLEHEDADDEAEGDQVGSDPHEAVLVWGLWRDDPRAASSHSSSITRGHILGNLLRGWAKGGGSSLFYFTRVGSGHSGLCVCILWAYAYSQPGLFNLRLP